MVSFSGVSCVVHFVLNEARPLLFFYLGWNGLLMQCGLNLATMTIKVGDGAAGVEPHETLQAYDYCIWDDIKGATHSLTSPFVGKCLTLDWNPWGWLNFSCILVIFFLVSVMTYHIASLARNNGKPGKPHKPLTFESGRFVRYTVFIQNKGWYRTIVRVFILYTVVAVGVVLFVGVTSVPFFDFLKLQAQGLILTIWGAYKFTQLHKPAFAMKNDTFKALKFKRGMMGLVNQSNDDLCQQMENALYNAQFQSYVDLKALVNLEDSIDGFKEEDAVDGQTHPKIEALLDALNPKAKEFEAMEEGRKTAAAAKTLGDGYLKALGDGYQKAPDEKRRLQ